MSAHYVKGEQKFITVPVDSTTVIAVGDLVYLDTDDGKPASAGLWTTDLATTQEAFHDAFLGVAQQASASGETDDIDVATCGVYEFDAASDTYELGVLVGPDKDTGNALLAQTVEDVAGENLAIGRVHKREATATTRVQVEIVGTVTHGGPQAMA